MDQRIGAFLMAMLVLWAVLLLVATDNRTVPQPTAPHDASSAAASTEPEEPVTTETDPVLATDPVPTDDQPEAAGTPSRVEALLQGQELIPTAKTHWVLEEGFNALDGTQGTAGQSLGRELAELSARRRMNPISAFWALVSEDVYGKTPDGSGRLEVPAFAAVQQEKKQYAYTNEGAALLLTELLTLAGQMEDGLALEQAVLGAERELTAERIFESPTEHCRYTYFAVGGECSTHILCFYLRSGDGDWITDVEFQLLNLNSAQGSDDALTALDQRADRQAAALMTAAELLMTGNSVAASGDVPFSYTLSGWDASVERFHFTAEGEQGTLTNYRLKMD